MKTHSRHLNELIVLILFCSIAPPALAQNARTKPALNPRAEALFREATRCMQTGGAKEENDALAAINEAIKLDSGNARYHAARASILFFMEEDEEAFKEAESALKTDPNNLEALCIKAKATARLGNPKQGILLMNEVIARSPQAGNFATRARIYFAMKKYNESATDLRQAIKLAPGNDSFHIDLTHTLEAMEDWPGVIEEATISCSVGTDHQSKAIKSRARAYAHLKQYDKAVADLKYALKIWPDDMKTHRELQQIYLQKGDAKNAAKEQQFIDKMNIDITGHK